MWLSLFLDQSGYHQHISKSKNEKDVRNWLRPAPAEFNISYNRGRHYIPDFVVETKDAFYIVEVKGEDKIETADVIAKGKRAVQFCKVATSWAEATGRKPWKYVFIPSQQIHASSSFNVLADRFSKDWWSKNRKFTNSRTFKKSNFSLRKSFLGLW